MFCFFSTSFSSSLVFLFRTTAKTTRERTTSLVVRRVAGSMVEDTALTSVMVVVNRFTDLLFAVLVMNISLFARPSILKEIVPARVMVIVNRCVASLFTVLCVYILLLLRSPTMEAMEVKMVAALTDVTGVRIR